MSNKEQAGAERGLVQQEVVMGVEDMTGEKSGLVDTQQQVYLACRSLDILVLHPAEERGDFGQVDRGRSAVISGIPKASMCLIFPEIVCRGTL